MERKPTLDDIAHLAGVGKGTASRVINGGTHVRKETREKVMKVINDLGYRPSSAARRLSRRVPLRSVGVLESVLTAPAFVDRLRGIQDVIESKEKFELTLYSCTSPERLKQKLDHIADMHTVEALIVVDLDVSEDQRARLASAGVTLVSISNAAGSGPQVGIDDERGGYVATRYLLELGHKRIAYLGDVFPDPFGFKTSRNRYRGYVQALEDAGLSIDQEYVQLGKHGKAEAQAMCATLLSLPDRPTAIFAMTDIQALGCLEAAREAKVNVPQDLSIIGFDDIEASSHVGLTTVTQHLSESGRVATQYVLGVLEGRRTGDPPSLPDVEVVVRRTTCPPREEGQ